MEKFFKLLTALALFYINGTGAYPMEAGENGTVSPNVTTTHHDSECPGVPKRYYEELNCKPVFKNPQDRCPIRYACDNFEKSDAEMCYFAGESVAPGTTLNDTGNPCDINCSCELEGPFVEYNVSKMAVFSCAIVDCPLEEASAYDENGDLRKCVPKKSHDECCASETVCIDGSDDNDDDDDDDNDNDDDKKEKSDKKEEVGDSKRAENEGTEEKVPKKLETCLTADNQTYVEGQEFYLEDSPCKVCICQPGYTAGESGEPWCREVRCGTVLRHSRQIREGCTPVYFDTNRCCPIDFHCPNATDTVISDTLVKTAPHPDETCKFGELFFRIGDRLATRTDEKCIECECELPPYLTCHRKPDC